MFHLPFRKSFSRLLSISLTYALVLVLCAPFSVAAKTKTRKQAAPLPAAASWQQVAHRTGEVLVKFRGGVSQRDRDIVIATHNTRRKKQLGGESGVEKLELTNGGDARNLALQLLANPAVEFAEPNFLITKDQMVPGDPDFGEQWALRNTGQSGGRFGSDINVSRAWETTTGSSSTVIAIIDSGIDFTHPDLANNKWTNPTPGPEGDLHGWDYVTNSPSVIDEQGHGTAVAGIVAAQGNNAAGIAGVMWRASLMSLRVLDNAGTGEIADAVEAIDYASTKGAQVINISWGTSGESQSLQEAIERANRRGVVVVCSAGNGGQDLDAVPYYPAAHRIRDLIAVAATDNFDQLASWSNWGRRRIKVAAPGTNIMTTRMGGGYWTVSGTSASAPLVSGVAGLMRSARPWLSVHNVARIIGDEAREVASLSRKVASGGVVDASGAIAGMRGMPDQPPVPPRTPGHGSGGNGPGGSFSGTPPPVTTGAPGANLPNLDQVRNSTPANHQRVNRFNPT